MCFLGYSLPHKQVKFLCCLPCSTLVKRESLDRRRLEEAHLKFAVLQAANRYTDYFSMAELLIYPDVHETLQSVTQRYYCAYQARYSGEQMYVYLTRMVCVRFSKV